LKIKLVFKAMGNKSTKDRSLQLEPEPKIVAVTTSLTSRTDNHKTITAPAKKYVNHKAATTSSLKTSTQLPNNVQLGASAIMTLPSSAILANGQSKMSLEKIFRSAKGNTLLEMFVLSTYIKSTTGIEDWNFSLIHKFKNDELFVYYLNMFDADSFAIYLKDYAADTNFGNKFSKGITDKRLSMVSSEKLRTWAKSVDNLVIRKYSKILRRLVSEELIEFASDDNPYKLLSQVVRYVNENFEVQKLFIKEHESTSRTAGDDFIDVIEMLMYNCKIIGSLEQDNDRTFPVNIFAECHPKISTLLLKFYENATQMMQAELATKEVYITNLESKMKTLEGQD
jgi:hypothetical protein